MRVAILAVVPAAMVAVVVVIPVVVVIEPAVGSVPVAGVVAATFVARPDPASALIRRTRPVTGMPAIVMAYRIPVAVYPEEFRARGHGADGNHARRGRWADLNADADLSGGAVSSEQEH